MNKKFIKIVLFSAIVAAAGWNISQSEKGAKLSDIALENVEALTGGEGLPQCHYKVKMRWVGPLNTGFLQKVCLSHQGGSCC